jgi:predicted membrane protein
VKVKLIEAKMETPKLHGRAILGLLLIILGGLFVLHNYEIIDLPENFLTWEYFFMLVGVLLLLLSRNKVAGIVFFSIGLFNLYPDLWPLVLVMIGFYILYGRKRSHSHKVDISMGSTETGTAEPVQSTDFIDSTSIFGGGSKVLFTDNFKGGNIVSIFGGSEINLSNCKMAPGLNVIEITAIFGGSTIMIPPDWKVEIDVLPIFGGFGDNRKKDPVKDIKQDATLLIKGIVLFGGGEIKTVF